MAFYKGAAHEAGRALTLQRKRQKEQEEMEEKKKKIEDELKVGTIANKFAAHYDAVEQRLKSDTIGLVTLNEMKAKQEDVIRAREHQIVVNKGETRLRVDSIDNELLGHHNANQRSVLSFDFDEDNEATDEETHSPVNEKLGKSQNNSCDAEQIEKETDSNSNDKFQASINTDSQTKLKKRFGMNPDVDTSFLPDREREEADAKLREQLRLEWVAKQEKIKSEEIDVTYSYWDGSGHRRTVRMKKGNTIQQFLQRCLENLRKEFNELRTASADQLMYIKEDLIIAHHFSFYDFIITKARGKSGPLFNFEAYDDVRLRNDATMEREDSHAGKVCLRSWYERNKHIFPANRWEPYDPNKSWDKYTISDKEATKIIVK